MAIEFNCECGRSYKVSDDLAGKRAKCKHCGKAMRVPALVPEVLPEPEFLDSPDLADLLPPPSPHVVRPPTFTPGPAPIAGAFGEGDLLDRMVVDTSTAASSTARADVDFIKYLSCYPQGITVFGIFIVGGLIGGVVGHPAVFIVAGVGAWLFVQELLAVRARFRTGDLNPAVIISDRPWRVATFVDMSTGRSVKPAILIQNLPMKRMTGGPPHVGMRTAAVVHYHGNSNSPDAWVDVEPTLVPLGLSNAAACARVVARITALQWRQLDSNLARLEEPTPGLHKLWLRTHRKSGSSLLRPVAIIALVVGVVVSVLAIGFVIVGKAINKAQADKSAAMWAPNHSPVPNPFPPPTPIRRPSINTPANPPTDTAVPSAGVSTPSSPRPVRFHRGSQVELLDGATWRPAVVTQSKADEYLVHRDGAADAWVKAHQIRANPNPANPVRLPPPESVPDALPTPPTVAAPALSAAPSEPRPPSASPSTYSAGQKVLIQWGNKWWPGVIKSVQGNGYRVSYDGWGASSDETVPLSRLKLP